MNKHSEILLVYSNKSQSFQDLVVDENQKAKKKERVALCTSYQCTGDNSGNPNVYKQITDAKRTMIDCPKCGDALFWKMV